MDTSSSKNKSNGHKSLSHSGRFCSSSSAFFSARSGPLSSRSSSPTRVNLFRSTSPSPTIRFSSTSPNRSISATLSNHHHQQNQPKKSCACSPTTHPGSFRCSLHKSQSNQHRSQNRNSAHHNSSQLNMRRSAMTNSLVRIGTVEGELVKRALAALIRPSSHHLRRRGDFQPRPSRLSIMSKVEN
ncbi:hypothetical protein LIER_07232 [Lithospermum erythrorhizon]|uniref:Serine-rich protein-like protein n=1 Tax=Lithospermum erythrorhizon TaxID=34254 RepID=A0AAV3PC24_LITER